MDVQIVTHEVRLQKWTDIADAFDAMTTHRAYGTILSEEEAINEIRKCSSAKFDPTIARIFIEKVLGKEWK